MGPCLIGLSFLAGPALTLDMNRLLSLTLLLGWTAAVSAQDIPSVELKDLADMTVDTRAFVEEAEGPVLFCFWATWCMPCRAEIPILNSIYDELHDEGLVILGITAEEEAVVQGFLKDRPISYPVVIDDLGRITNRYGIQAYPTLVMIDRDGNMVDRATGLDVLLKWKIRNRVTGSFF